MGVAGAPWFSVFFLCFFVSDEHLTVTGSQCASQKGRECGRK